MTKMFEKLLEIIRSDEFRVQLAELNDNFFNLKQELHIRDLLLVLFNYEESIQKHFKGRRSNGFILIVCDSDTKGRENFESIWLNDETMFSKLSSDNLKWKDNLKKKFEDKDLEAKSYFHEIKVDKPFETTYHFFILEGKNKKK